MPDREELLRDAVLRKTEPVYLTTKSQIVDYFKEKYDGKPDSVWKTAAAKALAAAAGKGGDAKAVKNERRNFEGDRLGKGNATAKWKKFGESLGEQGRKAKDNQITITVHGLQKKGGGKSGKRDRKITVTFSGSDAYTFVNNPEYSDIWNVYGWDFDEEQDGEYELDIYQVT